MRRSGGIFDFDAKAERLEEVSRELESPTVWDNPQRAQDLGRERASLERVVIGIRSLAESLAEAGDLLDLAIAEDDEGTAVAVADDCASTQTISPEVRCSAARIAAEIRRRSSLDRSITSSPKRRRRRRSRLRRKIRRCSNFRCSSLSRSTSFRCSSCRCCCGLN